MGNYKSLTYYVNGLSGMVSREINEETFVTTGPKTTIYIKGFHDTASQGGATYVDAIEVIDLGG